jgi:hypothetical protein
MPDHSREWTLTTVHCPFVEHSALLEYAHRSVKQATQEVKGYLSEENGDDQCAGCPYYDANCPAGPPITDSPCDEAEKTRGHCGRSIARACK